MRQKQRLLVLILLAVVGCGRANNPGEWSVETIQQKLLTKYTSDGLEQLEIKNEGSGKLSGFGKTKEGETLKITITQDPKSKRLTYEFKGDRGWIEEGVYELD